MGGSTSKPEDAIPAPAPRPTPAPAPASAPSPRPTPAPAPAPAPAPRPAPAPPPVFQMPVVQPPTLSNTAAATACAAVTVVTHNVNGYVVSDIVSVSPLLPDVGYINRGTRVDRHSIKVCLIYNKMKLKCDKNCHRFHVCQGWVIDKCSNSECASEHSFSSARNSTLAGPLLDSRFTETSLKNQLKENIEFSKKIRSRIEKNDEIICSFNIIKKCYRDNCNQVHLNDSPAWQVKDGRTWINLPRYMSNNLEREFCDPKGESLEVFLKNNEKNMQVLEIFQTGSMSKCSALFDFHKMNLFSANDTPFPIRRLSTASDVTGGLSQNTRWLWYKFVDNIWQFFTNGKVGLFHQIALSDHIEQLYQKGDEQLIIANNGTLDFKNMTMLSDNGYLVLVRRRPAAVVWAENTKEEKPKLFRDMWLDTEGTSLYSTESLPNTSSEYIRVCSMMQQTMQGFNVLKVERIQNKFLWKAYQLKKKLMLKRFGGDVSKLQEQYMFHGTKCDVLEYIYKRNLDWRLHGTNVGCVYGRGTYFANIATLSDGYSSGSPKVMLIAMVIIGDACIGNSSMTLPPINPSTKTPYDTTVNRSVNSEVYVKYNQDEYYPAYVVKYSWP